MKKWQAGMWMFALAAVLLLGWLAWVRLAPREWVYPQQMHAAQAMIERIEAYRVAHGALPQRAAAAGMEESPEGPYYGVQKDGTYTVSFAGGSCFFCSQVYDSRTRQWREAD